MNKKTRELYYSLWMGAIAVCIVLALFAVFLPSCTAKGGYVETKSTDDSDVQASAADTVAATASEEVQETVIGQVGTTLVETEDAGEDYLKSIVILGDSISAHYYELGLLDDGQVWTGEDGELTVTSACGSSLLFYGNGGETSHNLSTAVSSRTPDIMIIALGSYGLPELDESDFKTAYNEIITEIKAASPSTVVICQSIFPVLQSEVTDDTTNAMIKQANGWIRDVAELAGVYYLDTQEILFDSTDNLYSVYAESDGRMLTESGSDAVMEYIRTHAATS